MIKEAREQLLKHNMQYFERNLEVKSRITYLMIVKCLLNPLGFSVY